MDNDTTLTFNVPDIDLTTNIAYHLTLVDSDNRTNAALPVGGTDSAPIALQPRPSASASASGAAAAATATATVTVTAAPTGPAQAGGGNAVLGPALGLGLGLGLPLIAVAVAAALLFRKLQAERARRVRGVEGIARDQSMHVPTPRGFSDASKEKALPPLKEPFAPNELPASRGR